MMMHEQADQILQLKRHVQLESIKLQQMHKDNIVIML